MTTITTLTAQDQDSVLEQIKTEHAAEIGATLARFVGAKAYTEQDGTNCIDVGYTLDGAGFDHDDICFATFERRTTGALEMVYANVMTEKEWNAYEPQE